jgi:hypothetical protein
MQSFPYSFACLNHHNIKREIIHSSYIDYSSANGYCLYMNYLPLNKTQSPRKQQLIGQALWQSIVLAGLLFMLAYNIHQGA